MNTAYNCGSVRAKGRGFKARENETLTYPKARKLCVLVYVIDPLRHA